MSNKLSDLVSIVLLLGGAFLISWLFMSDDIGRLLTKERISAPEPTNLFFADGENLPFLLKELIAGTIDLEAQTQLIAERGFANNFIAATVLAVNESSHSLNLEINMPNSQILPLSTWQAQANCPIQTTYVIGESLKSLAERVDIFNYVQEGELLWTFCSNADCTIVGEECILHKPSL